MRCFERVDALVFCAALDEYGDEDVLVEDPSVLRLDESLQLFQDIIHHHFFSNSVKAIIFTKRDRLERKLRLVPFRVEGKRHDDFQGDPLSVEDVEVYLRNLYLDRYRGENRVGNGLYYHSINALDVAEAEEAFDVIWGPTRQGLVRPVGMYV
jgi:guanine nucleotide-binding protein subunit alpha